MRACGILDTPSVFGTAHVFPAQLPARNLLSKRSKPAPGLVHCSFDDDVLCLSVCLDDMTPSLVDEASSRTEATVQMCAKAFETIATQLRPDLPSLPDFDLPNSQGGVFVTWSVPRGRDSHYSLRGCIGTLSPAPLHIAVPRYAAQAAFHDSRFDPISSAELSKLKVGVSVLSQFESAKDVYDWITGVHGIVLYLPGGYSATYLPEVCAEHRWTKEFCLRSLAEKAGFRGLVDESVLNSASVTRYQSSKTELAFDDYMELVERTEQ
ncbi:AMMECR1 [Gracilaria domingensis]|nr:AMMECR1 [Gracilaria domingensis]